MWRILHRFIQLCAILLVISFCNSKTCYALSMARNPTGCSSTPDSKPSPSRVERSHDLFFPKIKSTSSLIPVMRTGRSVKSLMPAMRTGRSVTSLIPAMRTGRSVTGLIPFMRNGRSIAKSLIPMMRTGRSEPNNMQEVSEDVEYTANSPNKWLLSRYPFLFSNSPAADSHFEDNVYSTTAGDDPLNLHQNLEFLFDEDQ